MFGPGAQSMTPKQLQTFRQLLIQVCEEHLASGGKIIASYFNQSDGGRCPITCLTNHWPLAFLLVALRSVNIEMSSNELWDFIKGFDSPIKDTINSEMSCLGKDLRTLYIKENNEPS